MLVITNPETQEEQECRVVYLGDPGDNGQRVGVEFLTPAPRFWGVEFSEAQPAEDSSAVHLDARSWYAHRRLAPALGKPTAQPPQNKNDDSRDVQKRLSHT